MDVSAAGYERLNPGEMIRRVVRVFKGLAAHVWLYALILVLVNLLPAIAELLGVIGGSRSGLAGASFILAAILAEAIIRETLLPGAPFHLRTVLRLLGRGLQVILIAVLAIVPTIWLLMKLKVLGDATATLCALSEPRDLLSYGIVAGLTLIPFLVLLRFAPLFPAAVLGQAYSLAAAWRESRGHFLPAATVFVPLYLVVEVLPLFLIFTVPYPLLLVFALALRTLRFMVLAALLALSHRAGRDAEAAPA